jgi:hypothetical protein
MLLLYARKIDPGAYVATASQWLGLGAVMLIVAFVVFAFRQGDKVKRSDSPPPPSSYT